MKSKRKIDHIFQPFEELYIVHSSFYAEVLKTTKNLLTFNLIP
jgi:hypothetical protein